jgi:spectinomycin phosphotransferase
VSDVVALLAAADRLAADVAGRCANWVVTHGEPHAGNVMRTGGSHVLVDWDTVALAPPERDLWMVVTDTADEATVYADATGHQVDAAAVDLFRVTWDLADLAVYLNVLRSPHRRTADAVAAFDCVTGCATIRDRWTALLGG